MTGPEIATRIWRALRDRARSVQWAARPLDYAPDSPPNRAVLARDVPATRWNAGGFLLREDLPEPGHATHRLPNAQAILARADLATAGWSPLFELDPIRILDADAWHRDPLTGSSWPKSFAPLLNHRDTRHGSARLSWELHRLGPLIDLGMGWRITGNDRYAQGAARWLDHWMDANPPECGIGWQSPMELALRIIAVLHMADLLAGSGILSGARGRRLDPCMAHHAHAIARSISLGSSANNHTIGEAAGLVVAGTCLPLIRGAERLRDRGIRVLARELARQFSPDGSGREQSPHYQAFAMDFTVQALLAMHRRKLALPPDLTRPLEGSVRFLCALTSSSGLQFEPGDADDGLVHRFGLGPHHGIAETLRVTAQLLSRTELLPEALSSHPAPSVHWLLGKVDSSRLPARTKSSSVSPDAGAVVMRSSGTSHQAELFMDAGPHGLPPLDAHAHADALSMMLRIDGEPIIVDPGTYRYHGGGAWRDFFRSTAAHATVEVDGQDQSQMAGPFLWSSRTHTRLRDLRLGGAIEVAEFSHDGYERLRSPVTHRRRIVHWGTGIFVIQDRFETTGLHDYALHYPFAPGTQVKPLPPGDTPGICATTPSGAELRIRTVASAPLETHVVEGNDRPLAGWFSPGFGVRTPSPTGCFRAQALGPTDFTSVLVSSAPRSPISPRLEVERLHVYPTGSKPLEPSLGLRICTHDAEEIVLVTSAACPSASGGGWRLRGHAGVARRLSGSESWSAHTNAGDRLEPLNDLDSTIAVQHFASSVEHSM